MSGDFSSVNGYVSSPALVRLVLALNRAQITPFAPADWSGYCDAQGNAHMVKFWPEDDHYFRVELGIQHWHPDCTVVILDECGITWTAIGAVNGYAHQVRIGLGTDCYDVSTPEEYWRVENKGHSAVDLAIADLPENQRILVLAAPEDVREMILIGMGVLPDTLAPKQPPEVTATVKLWCAPEDGEHRVWVRGTDGKPDKLAAFASLSTADKWVAQLYPDLQPGEYVHRRPVPMDWCDEVYPTE